MGLASATWEEDEHSHRSGVGRWALARGYVGLFWLTIAVVLEVAGLPEPPDNEPSDTMPFFVSRKKYGSQRWSFWSVAEGETIESIEFVFACECDAISIGFLNRTAACRLPLAERS